MSIIHDDFMLRTETAKRLYHDYAENLPIIDYHCHLSPAEIASDKRFASITEAWLGGDHYKWRLMRINGVSEDYITGQADDFEKFMAYAKTLETAIGNPLYHWTHLEMKRFFGINEYLTADNARKLYDQMNEMIVSPEFSAKRLIERSRVETICTTDDPVDSLEYHKAVAAEPIKNCTVRPTFRPDRAVIIERDGFDEYMRLLSAASGITVDSFDSMKKALSNRIEFFHDNGCRLSDHDFGKLPEVICDEALASNAWEKRANGGVLTDREIDAYKTCIMLYLAGEFSKHGWTMQLHMGAMRNNSSRMFASVGKDTGFDTMSDYETAYRLGRLLDAIDSYAELPRTVLYSLNPKDNYALAALCGCFTAPGVRGKTQFGSAWWFVDHRDGMEKQLRDTASLNLLSCFIGMLTDSRSFLSFPRHEYFRRILCNLLGEWVENGEYPKDQALLSRIVEGICYKNAKDYFAF
ncbi:MAG: glucuronate isomerase [Clostridia bacterium]|nr:glucuronate isomerase [Clostridia bacterium]